MKKYSFIFLSILASCGWMHTSPSRITIAYNTERGTWNLDPSTATREVDLKAISYTQHGLMKLTPTLDTQPHLVLPPKVSKDGFTLMLTIRPGLKWSDGVALTAQHVQDGLLRSLNSPASHTSIQSFKKILTQTCQDTQAWSSCITVSGQTLHVTFSIMADLALPFFTQPFTFPQRLDVFEKRNEKPFVSPGAYPTVGDYKITKQDAFELDLDPVDDTLKPLKLIQVDAGPADEPIGFDQLFAKGKIHILEPPPLKFLEDSTWGSSLKTFTDYNLVLLLQAINDRTSSIAHVARPEKIRRYIEEKGLTLAETPAPLLSFVQGCTEYLPKVVVYPEGAPVPQDITLFGPKHIFTFLAAESIKKQLLHTYKARFKYSALDMPDLTYYQIQHKTPYTLYIFRDRTAVLHSFLSLFLSNTPGRLTAVDSTFFNFLYEKYLHSPPQERQKVHADMIRVLCHDAHWILPLGSIPAYAVVSPRITGISRDGSGVYRIWDLK